jgi:hypothetical protein
VAIEFFIEFITIPWLGPAARAALRHGDDQIVPPAMAGGVTLLAAVGRPAAAARRPVAVYPFAGRP